MRLQMQVGGRTRTVAVEALPGNGRCYRVTIDGTARLVDLYRLDASTVSLVFAGDRTPSSHEVSVVGNGGRGALAVGVRGATIELSVNGARTRQAAGDAAPGAAGAVKALMPGRVVRVLVAPGADVAVRQPLVVIEAMKMENELLAPVAGRVTDVLVEPGDTVETGRVIVRMTGGGTG